MLLLSVSFSAAMSKKKKSGLQPAAMRLHRSRNCSMFKFIRIECVCSDASSWIIVGAEGWRCSDTSGGRGTTVASCSYWHGLNLNSSSEEGLLLLLLLRGDFWRGLYHLLQLQYQVLQLNIISINEAEWTNRIVVNDNTTLYTRCRWHLLFEGKRQSFWQEPKAILKYIDRPRPKITIGEVRTKHYQAL